METSTTTRVVSATTGETYAVTVRDNGTGYCTCKGFHFHKRCKHLTAAREAMAATLALTTTGA